MLIRDGLNEISANQDEIKSAIESMPRGTTKKHKEAVKAGIATLDGRIVGIGSEYKQFFQSYQAMLKKQEAKKKKLMGISADTKSGAAAKLGTSSSLSNKRHIKILP